MPAAAVPTPRGHRDRSSAPAEPEAAGAPRPAGTLTNEPPTHRSASVTKSNGRWAVPVDAALLGQMVRAIVDDVDPDQVILFGSHARRDARPDSDVDLIVVEREPFGPDRSRFVEMNRLYDTLSHFFVPKDILVFSRDEVERWRNSINHVLARSLREGVVLYERP